MVLEVSNTKLKRIYTIFLATLTVGLSAVPGAARASSNTIIYAFHGTSDGGTPEAGLIIDKNGVIYGTADRDGGGARNSGTIYSFTPPATEGGSWTRTMLYRFTGGADGGYPLGLTLDKAGNLYGYTSTSNSGFGLVFKLVKPAVAGRAWRYSVLHQFQGGSADGAYLDGLTAQPDGSLVGATSHGGSGPCSLPDDPASAGCGIVYRLTPPAAGSAQWGEQIVYKFAGRPDGALPNGAPILINGVFWGVTVEGGAGQCPAPGGSDIVGCGTVYTLTQTKPGTWVESTAYSFQGGVNGWGPIAGLAVDHSGALYGVTAFGGPGSDFYGGGTAYRLLPSTNGAVTLTVIHSFTGNGDGRSPQGGVLVTPAGKVYGTTYLGPEGYFGTVFELMQRPAGSNQWVEYILGKFQSPAGVYPSGQIVRDALGAIYGVTLEGGRFGQGTLFKVVE